MEQTKMRSDELRWLTVIVSALLALLFIVETPISVYAAGEKGTYVKEVIMITASGTDEARQKTKTASDKAGETYTLFETPIYDCGGVKTYVAYTTTTNKANAVKSIKAMNMKGEWSYEEYDKYLDQLMDKANFLAADLYKAITEYAECLAANKPNALYAKKILDYLYEDDSKQTVSDFFVQMAKKGKYENAKNQMITFTMQANSSILATVESALMIACADAYRRVDNDINFMTGIVQQTYVNGMNGFVNNPNYAKYDVYVQDLLVSLPDVQEDIRFYMNSGHMIEDEVEEMAMAQEDEIIGGLTGDPDNAYKEYLELKNDVREAAAGEENLYDLSEEDQEAARKLEAFEKYYDGLSIAEQSHYTNGKIYYNALKSCPYKGYYKNGKYQYENLLGLIMAHDKMEEYTNEDFYPIIHKLTNGQQALLKVGFSQLLSSILIPADVLDIAFNGMLGAINETAETEDEKIKKGDVVSVYEGIDRSLFEKNSGIALTREAIINAQDKPFAHVATTVEKIQNICDIVAIASGCVAATSIITAAGFAVSLQSAVVSNLNIALAEAMEYPLHYAFKAFAFMGEPFTTSVEITSEGLNVAAGVFGYNPGIDTLASSIGKGLAVVEQTGAKQITASFSNCLNVFFKVGFGAFLKWVSIVSIGIMIISLIIKYLAPLIAEEGDEPYVNIPRIMCSYQAIDGQEGLTDPEEDYIYYYGVKNPLLTDADQQRALVTKDNKPSDELDVTKYMIGDVCNWTLKGLSRQWVALYASTDTKSGKPILAGSFSVLTDAADFNKDTSLISVKLFSNTKPLNFHDAYDITVNQDSAARYLAYKVDTTTSTQSASVFSNISVWGGIIAALVIGGGAGTLITYTVIRKRKKRSNG